MNSQLIKWNLRFNVLERYGIIQSEAEYEDVSLNVSEWS